MQSLTFLRGCVALGSATLSSGELESMGIIRYEPLIKRASWGESAVSEFIQCKNDLCFILPNSKFIIPVLLSDKNRHQEEN